MRQRIIYLVLLFSLNFISKAQNMSAGKSDSARYFSAMAPNVSMADTATAAGTLTLLANNFERIAQAEKNDWLSYYYAANCYFSLAALSENKDIIDDYNDRAELNLSKADSLSKNNSEIYCLYYLLCYTRLKADPMGRYQKYFALGDEYLNMGKQADPGNPRLFLCQAQIVFHTPEAFGGGKKAAKILAEEAIRKYESFVPKSNLHPNWGKNNAQLLMKKLEN